MRTIRTASLLVPAVAALAIGGIAGANAGLTGSETQQPRSAASQPSDIAAPEVIVVAFHADWCGHCRTLGPKLMESVIPSAAGDPALFITLDLTDRDSKQAEYHMAALGLGHVWNEHKGKTGFALVIDADSKRVVHTFRANHKADDMAERLQAALNG